MHDPVAPARPGAARAARRPGRRRRVHALPRRGARRAAALPRRRPLVPGPGRQPAATGRLLLARVRHRRGRCPSTPAASACWPATTSRRPATSACRSWASASSTGTATSASRLDADGWQQERYPDLDPHAMALHPVRRHPRRGRPGRRAARRPGVEGRASAGCRCTSSTPTSTRTPTRSAQVTDRLYGGDTEHRLRQEILLGIGGVRALEALGVDAQVFHTNEGHAGFLGLERIRQLVIDQGLSYREAIEAVRAGVHLHHPHPGAGRHRPLPARADRALLRRVGRRGRHRARRADGARAPARRRPRRAVQHGRHGPAPGRPVQRRGQAPRRGQPRDVQRPLARRRARRDADHLDHQRRARRTRGCRPRWPTCSPATCSPSGTRPAPSAGPASPTPPTTSCGGPASRAASAWSPSCAGACARPPLARGLTGSRRGVDRRGARPPRAHHRLRPPLRHLQAGHAAAVAARPAAGAAAVARPAGAARVRRQGPPGRRAGQGDDPPDRRIRGRPRGAPPLRVRRRLRHRRRPRALPGRRRLAEQPPASAGGVRHLAA